MKNRKLSKNIVIFVLLVAIFSLFFYQYRVPYIEALGAKIPIPGRSSIHCGHKITDLPLSYKEKLTIIKAFNNDKLVKKGLKGKELYFSPYIRKVKIDNGKIYTEIWYRIKTNNVKKIQMIIGVREEFPVKENFTVQLSTALRNRNTWKNWTETDHVFNNNRKITLNINENKASIVSRDPSASSWLCDLSCFAGCEAGCAFVDPVLIPACELPCHALCFKLCGDGN